MKKALLLTGVVAVAIASGILVTHHYQQYKNQQITQQAQLQRSIGQTEVKINNLEVSYRTQYAALKQECQKGLIAYGKLPTSIKAQTTQPVCD